MEISYSKAALRFLAKTDKNTLERIRWAVNGLTLTPPKGDVKLMQGYGDKRFRLRVGKYRIIFKIEDVDGSRLLSILDIDSRGEIYK